MNYFAHGHDEIDSPERLAGTALPDWLGASDRRARLRRERLDRSELAAGVRRHYRDDRWFHSTPAFLRTAADVSAMIRATPTYDHGQRGWFLGHVLVEMLVDRFLILKDPARLDAYYDALDSIDPHWLERAVRPWLTRAADLLLAYLSAFRRHRYLYGYLDDDGLFRRLRGLSLRVGLPALPDAIGDVLPRAGRLVERRMPELMRAPR